MTETTPTRATIVRARGTTRSTQSFVYVLAWVWKRPWLTATEIAWRWLCAVPLLLVVWRWAEPRLNELQADAIPLQTMSLVHPVPSLETLAVALVSLWAVVWPLLRWLAPVALLAWVSVGAVGQWIVMRRLATKPHRTLGAIWLARFFRSLGVLLFWVAWAKMCAVAARVTITDPNAHGGTPMVMPLVAIVVVGSLVIFTAWGAVSWPLALAQAIAVERGCGYFEALGRAVRMRSVRGLVMEVNLVLCIVKLALVVLAMVFSACPLPFSSVETTEFLVIWTLGVGVWYLAMSDFFHVVRAADYLLLVEENMDDPALTSRG